MSRLEGKIELKHERVDDLPLVCGLLEQLQLAKLLDAHLGHHHLHKGLSNGQLCCVWLAFVLSEGDHRKVALQPWALNRQHMLVALLRQPLRPTDFTDDRLAILLRRLARSPWHSLEAALWQASCLVFELVVDSVRLDATTVSGYHRPTPGGLMQRGHSKAHRPDLAQLKLMAAAAQPHGHVLACAVVSGEKADDPLYTPLIKRVRLMLNRRGLLYVGDCKMAALTTRGELAHSDDYYLTIMPMTGETVLLLPVWIDSALADPSKIVKLSHRRGDEEVELGEGYEWTRTCETKVGKQAVKWEERVQLIRTTGVLAAQLEHLETRLRRASEEVKTLTPAPGPGRRVFREEAKLVEAITQVLKRHEVEGLLVVEWQEQRQVRERYVGRGRGGPDRPRVQEVKLRYEVTKVSRQEETIKARKQRLGWRVQVTNVPVAKMSMRTCLLTYQEGWSLERDFHLVKDKPLGISPLHLEKEEQRLAGLYEGQAKRTTDRPTAVRLLRAISRLELTLTHVTTAGEQGWHLPPLPDLLRHVLALLGLSPSLYESLTDSPFSSSSSESN
jgi:transposase